MLDNIGLDYLMHARISLYYTVGQTYHKNSACPSPSVTIFKFFLFLNKMGKLKYLTEVKIKDTFKDNGCSHKDR